MNLANLTANSFNINLSPTNVPGSPTTFGQVQYTLGTFAGGVTGASGNITNLFNFTGLFASAPSVNVQGNNILITFNPVPEPTGILAACGVATGVLGWIRRRRFKPLAA